MEACDEKGLWGLKLWEWKTNAIRIIKTRTNRKLRKKKVSEKWTCDGERPTKLKPEKKIKRKFGKKSFVRTEIVIGK